MIKHVTWIFDYTKRSGYTLPPATQISALQLDVAVGRSLSCLDRVPTQASMLPVWDDGSLALRHSITTFSAVPSIVVCGFLYLSPTLTV